MCAGLSAQNKVRVYAAAFYNLENLWDTEDDPNNRGDDDFTPDGQYNWTEAKYQQKLKNIAKVISGTGTGLLSGGTGHYWNIGSGKPEGAGGSGEDGCHC